MVRVSTLRSRTDLTHWRPAPFNGYGTGGWWNFGGFLREVYVRPVDTVDVEARAGPPAPPQPALARARGGAHPVRTLSAESQQRGALLVPERPRRRRAGSTLGQTMPAGAHGARSARAWTIEHAAAVAAAEARPLRPRRRGRGRGAKRKRRRTGPRCGTYRAQLRRAEVRDAGAAVLYLNGQPHATCAARASTRTTSDDGRPALLRRTRSYCCAASRDLGATVTRAHYPLHPAFLEALDRAGDPLLGRRLPVYQLPELASSTLPASAASAAGRSALTVENEPQPPVDLRLVARRTSRPAAAPSSA